MIGDSWESDIMGAHGFSMRAVWLNRFGAALPAKLPLVRHISSYDALTEVSEVLLEWN